MRTLTAVVDVPQRNADNLLHHVKSAQVHHACAQSCKGTPLLSRMCLIAVDNDGNLATARPATKASPDQELVYRSANLL